MQDEGGVLSTSKDSAACLGYIPRLMRLLTSLNAVCLPFYTQLRNFHLPIIIGSWVHFLRPAIALLLPVCCNGDFYDLILGFTCEFCEIVGKVRY